MENPYQSLEPLYSLLKEDVLFLWGPAQKKAFEQAKQTLTTAPTLAYFDTKK